MTHAVTVGINAAIRPHTLSHGPGSRCGRSPDRATPAGLPRRSFTRRRATAKSPHAASARPPQDQYQPQRTQRAQRKSGPFAFFAILVVQDRHDHFNLARHGQGVRGPDPLCGQLGVAVAARAGRCLAPQGCYGASPTSFPEDASHDDPAAIQPL
jgi:hypothetical protein